MGWRVGDFTPAARDGGLGEQGVTWFSAEVKVARTLT